MYKLVCWSVCGSNYKLLVHIIFTLLLINIVNNQSTFFLVLICPSFTFLSKCFVYKSIYYIIYLESECYNENYDIQ